MFAQAHITGGVTAVAAAVKDHRCVTGITVNSRINVKDRMMFISRSQRVVVGVHAPVAGIMTGGTTGHFASIAVTTTTG